MPCLELRRLGVVHTNESDICDFLLRPEYPEKTYVVPAMQPDRCPQGLVALLAEAKNQRGEKDECRPHQALMKQVQGGKNQAGEDIGQAEPANALRKSFAQPLQ